MRVQQICVDFTGAQHKNADSTAYKLIWCCKICSALGEFLIVRFQTAYIVHRIIDISRDFYPCFYNHGFLYQENTKKILGEPFSLFSRIHISHNQTFPLLDQHQLTLELKQPTVKITNVTLDTEAITCVQESQVLTKSPRS